MTISRYTRWATLLFPLLLPLYVIRMHIGPLPTTLLELSWLVILIAVTWHDGLSIWKQGLDCIKTWRLPIIAWIAVTALAIFVAPNHVAAFGLWRAYVIEPILYFIILAATIKTEADREFFIKSFVGISVIIALWSIIQFVTNQGIPHPWNVDILHRRATGPFPFPNAVSLFCAPIAALCVGLIARKTNATKSFRTWVIVGFIAATIATLLAKSVGGMIAIGVATFIVLMWHKKTRIATLIGCAAIGLTLWFIPPIHNIIVKTLTFNEWSGKVRTIIWKESWNMLKDHPIFGAGFGAYPDVIKPYHKATFIEIFQYPHNILLNFWSETGLAGVLIFGWIVVTWVRSTLSSLSSRAKSDEAEGPLSRTTDRSAKRFLRASSDSLVGMTKNKVSQKIPWALLPLIAILVQGLVDVPYFKNDLSFAFWMFAAMTLAIPSLASEPHRSTHA